MRFFFVTFARPSDRGPQQISNNPVSIKLARRDPVQIAAPSSLDIAQ
jgi:hypothetical protein